MVFVRIARRCSRRSAGLTTRGYCANRARRARGHASRSPGVCFAGQLWEMQERFILVPIQPWLSLPAVQSFQYIGDELHRHGAYDPDPYLVVFVGYYHCSDRASIRSCARLKSTTLLICCTRQWEERKQSFPVRHVTSTARIVSEAPLSLCVTRRRRTVGRTHFTRTRNSKLL